MGCPPVVMSPRAMALANDVLYNMKRSKEVSSEHQRWFVDQVTACRVRVQWNIRKTEVRR